MARIVPGIEVRNFATALVAAAVLAIVNFTIGWMVTLVALPLTVSDFRIVSTGGGRFPVEGGVDLHAGRLQGSRYWNAILGALVLTILTSLLRLVVF